MTNAEGIVSDYLTTCAGQLDAGAPDDGATDEPCPRCGEPMGTVLFGIVGSPFCAACLEPMAAAPTGRPSDGPGED